MGVPARTPGAIHTSERAEAAARRMRREPTLAERLLWKELRALDLPVGHFRRQAPFGAFVVDFVHHASRLIVEADGGIHDLDEVATRDASRSAWLTERGYRVLRLSNNEIINSPEAAAERIRVEVCARTPAPGPSPQGGGEQGGY